MLEIKLGDCRHVIRSLNGELHVYKLNVPEVSPSPYFPFDEVPDEEIGECVLVIKGSSDSMAVLSAYAETAAIDSLASEVSS